MANFIFSFEYQAVIRRSIRLILSGYYGEDGKPTISYKERLFSVFKRCRRKKKDNNVDVKNNDHSDTDSSDDIYEDAVIYGGSHAESDTASQPYPKQPKRSDKNSKTSSVFNKKTFVALFYMVMLCLGLTMTVMPSQPTKLPAVKDPTPCENALENIKVMREELFRLKNTINQWQPTAETLPNVALETLGAQVREYLSSSTYTAPSCCTFFGLRFRAPSTRPKIVIQERQLQAGDCWPFSGDHGHLVIVLPYAVHISHVTMGHISKTVSPIGHISEAPKTFTVYGSKTKFDQTIELGTFLYDQNGDSLQTFKLPHRHDNPFRSVMLQVHSNWGHSQYTCLYNFRVHGVKAVES